MSTLSQWHSIYDGRRWRVVPRGIEVSTPQGVEVLRTAGEPLTMRLYVTFWWPQLVAAAVQHRVPIALLMMTLGTENGPARVHGSRLVYPPYRHEPGYVSDEATPDKVSVGPCHVLISTARAALGRPTLTRDELADVGTNLLAAAAYIAHQREMTGYDPILVAAAYNAGGLYDSTSHPNPRLRNEWHLRAYDHDGPDGPGEDHLTRAARWYGDACAVLLEYQTSAGLDREGLGRVVT